MKKIFIVLFLLMAICVFGQGKVNPMSTFMGMKWGVPQAEFKANFKYKADLKQTDQTTMEMNDFKLGSLVLEKVVFLFDGKKADVPLKSASFKIKPSQFDDIFQILEKKYGKPTKIDRKKVQIRGTVIEKVNAEWTDKTIKRQIMAYKFFVDASAGIIAFIPYDKSTDKEATQQDAVDQL